MQFLIDFAAEDDEFQRILRRVTDYATVQGVVLDIDRFWLYLWELKQRWGDDRLELVNRYYDYEWLFGWCGDRRRTFGLGALPSPLGFDDVNKWRPAAWRHRQQRLGLSTKSSPIVVKVCLRPRLTPEEVYPTLQDLAGLEGRLQVEIEIRPRAQLSSDPRKVHSPLPGGVSIGVGPADYGTLGVILTDGAATHFGVTCAHVAGPATDVTHPARRDSSAAAVIGKTIASSVPVSCPPGVKCNPWSGVVPNEIDASLVEIDAGSVSSVLEVLDVGPLSGVMARAAMSTAQPIEVMGRTSRLNALQVGGLAAWYSFNRGGTDYCFKNLFEVESPYATAGVIRLGDSGAPVCADGPGGTEWAGMIVGRDSFKGYAIYAESIQNWLLGQGYTLVVT